MYKLGLTAAISFLLGISLTYVTTTYAWVMSNTAHTTGDVQTALAYINAIEGEHYHQAIAAMKHKLACDSSHLLRLTEHPFAQEAGNLTIEVLDQTSEIRNACITADDA